MKASTTRSHSSFPISLLIALFAAAVELARAAEPVVQVEKWPSVGERVSKPAASTNLSSGTRVEKPRLRLSSLPQAINGGIQIPTVVVMAESNKFAFLPPHGWHVESDALQKKVELIRPQSGSAITLRIVEEISGRKAGLQKEVLLQKISSLFPSAKVTEDSTLSALGMVGPAFDLEWRTTSGSRRKARACFIPFAGGYFECVLTSSPENAGQDCQSLNQVLLSLRCAPLGGKLDLPSVTPE